MTLGAGWKFLGICFALMVCCFIYDIFVPPPQPERHVHGSNLAMVRCCEGIEALSGKV